MSAVVGNALGVIFTVVGIATVVFFIVVDILLVVIFGVLGIAVVVFFTVENIPLVIICVEIVSFFDVVTGGRGFVVVFFVGFAENILRATARVFIQRIP